MNEIRQIVLHLLQNGFVDRCKSLYFEPHAGVSPEFWRPRLVGRLLVDFLFQNGDMGVADVEEVLPLFGDAFPNVLQNDLHAFESHAIIVRHIVGLIS